MFGQRPTVWWQTVPCEKKKRGGRVLWYGVGIIREWDVCLYSANMA